MSDGRDLRGRLDLAHLAALSLQCLAKQTLNKSKRERDCISKTGTFIIVSKSLDMVRAQLERTQYHNHQGYVNVIERNEQ